MYKVTLDDELYRFLGIDSKNILKKSCLKQCAKEWVAITAGTLLFCYYFSRNITGLNVVTNHNPLPTTRFILDSNTLCSHSYLKFITNQP